MPSRRCPQLFCSPKQYHLPATEPYAGPVCILRAGSGPIAAQMLAGTAEHVAMAEREVRTMQRLRHPNLLPLLACERRELQGGDQEGVTAFYMLFSLFPVLHHLTGVSAPWVMWPPTLGKAWRMQHAGCSQR